MCKEYKNWDQVVQGAGNGIEASMPAMVNVGSSGVGKSTLIGGLASKEYQGVMWLFVGGIEGCTTSFPTKILIVPKSSSAAIFISDLKDGEAVLIGIFRHLQMSLAKPLKDFLSSRPKKPEEWQAFLRTSVEKHLVPHDRTFRIDRLLKNDSVAWERYWGIMTELLCIVADKADDHFRASYLAAAKESKQEANRMIDDIIMQALFPDNEEHPAQSLAHELRDIIIRSAHKCLQEAGFAFSSDKRSAYTETHSPDDLKPCVQAITNSSKSKHTSAACVIGGASLMIPGPGIYVKGVEKPYLIYDVVGFDNDGEARYAERVRDALLTPAMYDVINYVQAADTTLANNRDNLMAIQQSLRPSKLIVSVTKFDRTEVFDNDDISVEELQNEVSRIKTEVMEQVEIVFDSITRVLLPTKPDIICFANTKRALGVDANGFFAQNNPYNMLRAAIAKAHTQLQDKIILKGAVSSDIIAAQAPVQDVIGQIIRDITKAVSDEYRALRDRSANIHHWTIDAILWNLYECRQHVSDAAVWENVRIRTFSNIATECAKHLLPAKLAPGLGMSDADRDRLMQEFESNLQMDLVNAAKDMIIRENGKCKTDILNLARTSKYNKWRIFDDLDKNLLVAVSKQDYLIERLEKSVELAIDITLKRLL